MKPLTFLGLIAPLLLSACGDDGGDTATASATGSTTTTGSTTDVGPTTGPTTSTPTTSTTGGTLGETTGVDTTTSTTTSTDSTDTAVATETDATTTTSTGTTTSSTGDSDTDETSSGSSDSSTGEPSGDPLAIALKEVVIYANCMPIVDPDNILGWWTVTYDNTQGAETATAELTKATITLSPNNMPSVHDITVTPTLSGPVGPGLTVQQPQMKLKGAPTPGCSFCNQPYRLDLTFASGGVDVPVVHEATLDCVY